MNTIQAIRRLRQQTGSFDKAFDTQLHQVELAKKLYAKNGFDLQLTCSACPEQYDVLMRGENVGHLRLRHGRFRVEYPDIPGETIFEAYPNGDGIFEDNERLVFLTKALRAIQDKIKQA